MPKKLYPANVLEQGESVLAAWNQFAGEIPFGSLTPTVMQNALTEAAAIRNQLMVLEAQMTDLRNQRDEKYRTVWDYTKKVRSAVKGIYGDDSSQYEMVGGTRLSERASYTPPPVPPTPDL